MERVLSLFVLFLRYIGLQMGHGRSAIDAMEKTCKAKNWMTKEEYEKEVNMVKKLPGVFSINFAACLGYRVGKIFGSVLSVLGVLLPPVVVSTVIAYTYIYLSSFVDLAKFVDGVRFAFLGMLCVWAFRKWRSVRLTFASLFIPIVVALLIGWFNFSALFCIAVIALIVFIYCFMVIVGKK